MFEFSGSIKSSLNFTSLGLDPNVVSKWFINRRVKLRNEGGEGVENLLKSGEHISILRKERGESIATTPIMKSEKKKSGMNDFDFDS